MEILWAEETLPLAAAQQIRAGKVLYRDIWFDKPPLAPALYTALGGEPGWGLRLAGALYSLLCCWLAWGFARDLWGRSEGLWAAGLLGFFLIFDFPASVIPLAADFLMLAPHVAAVWLAYRRRPVWSGVLAGIAFTINPKGVLVLAVCAWWAPSLAVAGGVCRRHGCRARRGCGARDRSRRIGMKSGGGGESTQERRSSMRP